MEQKNKIEGFQCAEQKRRGFLYDLVSNYDIQYVDLEFKGRISDVVGRIGRTLNKGRLADLQSKDALELILDVPRVLRYLIDRKISSGSEASERYISEAVEASLSVYSLSDDARNKFFKLELDAGKEFERAWISQQSDYVSWESSYPDRSTASAKLLAEDTKLRDVLFIPLAHGAISAGLDVYLRYLAQSGSDDSEFYPIRFSRYKLYDKQPQISKSELDHLINASKGRNIVIFDEDTGGRTLAKACEFFNASIPNYDGRILGLTNNNSGGIYGHAYRGAKGMPCVMPRSLADRSFEAVLR